MKRSIHFNWSRLGHCGSIYEETFAGCHHISSIWPFGYTKQDGLSEGQGNVDDTPFTIEIKQRRKMCLLQRVQDDPEQSTSHMVRTVYGV